MIKVVVEKYCHNCPYFEPEIQKCEDIMKIKDPMTLINHFDIMERDRRTCDTTIYCQHRARCETISSNINELIKYGGTDNDKT